MSLESMFANAVTGGVELVLLVNGKVTEHK